MQYVYARPDERIDHDCVGAVLGPGLEYLAAIGDPHLQARLAPQAKVRSRDLEHVRVDLEHLLT